MSLAGIAEVAGFCDQSHLNRAFRRRFGVSPGNFRRMFQASKTRTPARAMVPG
jgi:AraC-like DNA-binding protein